MLGSPPEATWAGGVGDGDGVDMGLCCKVRDLESQDH